MEIVNKTIGIALIYIVRVYQKLLSPFLAGSCRHVPTCSQYTIDAIKHHGVFKGLYSSMLRIFRCRPGGSFGYDPVEKDEDK